MPKALPGLALLLLLWGGVVPGGAAPLEPPYDLYEIGPLPDGDLRVFSDAPGSWVALHQERAEELTWVLLALPDGVPSEPPPGIRARPRYLGRVRGGERVVLSAPAEGGERLRTGRPVTITPSGGTVHVTTDAPGALARRSPHQFRLLEQAAPPPPPRAPGPPEGFLEALDRGAAIRPGSGLRSAQDVVAVRDAVRLDSLRAHVFALSEEASGQPTSRWWEDTRTRGVHTDFIVDGFDQALSPVGGRVFEHGFLVPSEEFPGQTVEVYNIVGHLPAVRPPGQPAVSSRGAILLTAHMDATGFRNDPVDLCNAGYKDDDPECDCENAATDRDCEWSGASDPAPGADDNATGVAALLEAARVLSALSFDFDLYFVAFQAEEIGLVGSAAYADSVAGGEQEIWGVLNMDMLGYNPATNELDVMTDESSEWLADWIVESAELFVPILPVSKYLEPFGRSDHASFWARGIDAVLLLEDKDLLYPGYHRVNDTWETMVLADARPEPVQQLLLAVQLAVVSIARFSVHYEVPDLALPAGELDARPANPVLGFTKGQGILLTAGVRNFGTSFLDYQGTTTDSLEARVRFFDGHPDSGAAVLGEVVGRELFESGGRVDFPFVWDTDAAEVGFHEIWAEVEGLDDGYAQTEASRDNNRTSFTLFLKAAADEGPRILAHYAYPNPAPGGSSLGFYYELSKNSSVRMKIFDLEGTLVSQLSVNLDFITDGNRAGVNRIGPTAFGPDLDKIDLESGVYLYVLQVGDGDRFTDHVKGKFAIVK